MLKTKVMHNIKYLVFFIFLFLSFGLNLFRIVPDNFFDTFQLDSEQLVTHRIQHSFEEGIFSNAGLLLNIDEEHQIIPYLGQLGFQGFIFSLFNNLTFGLIPISFFHFLVSALTGFTLVGIFFHIDKLTDRNTSIILFLIVMLASPFLSSMARNLYWVPGTMLLPLLFMFEILQDLIKHERLISKKHAFQLFLLFSLRFSMGFEFTSTILIAGSIPLLFTLNEKSHDYFLFLKRFAQYVIIGISSFITVLTVHIIQKAFYFGNLIEALQQQLFNVAKRSNIIQGIEVDQIYLESLDTNYISIIASYIMSPVLLLIVTLGIVTILHILNLYKKKSTIWSPNSLIIVSAWLAFLAPVSWYVLASGHSAIHFHINYVLWSIPFSLFSAAAIYNYAINNRCFHSKWYKVSAKIFVISSLFVSFAFNFALYSDNRETRLFMANIYHEIMVRANSIQIFDLSVKSVSQSGKDVSIITLYSVRAESLLSLNGGYIVFDNQELLCAWDSDEEHLLLSCDTEKSVSEDEKILRIIFSRE